MRLEAGAAGPDALLRLQTLGLAVHHATRPWAATSIQRSALKQATRHDIVRQADWVYVCDADEFLTIKIGDGSVQALTAVRLLRMEQSDFAQLLSDAWTRRLSARIAESHVASGAARWLDVRLPSERRGQPLPGSLHIPLYCLRAKAGALPDGIRYICVCDNGRRSAVAAFILAHSGRDACVLENGLQGMQVREPA